MLSTPEMTRNWGMFIENNAINLVLVSWENSVTMASTASMCFVYMHKHFILLIHIHEPFNVWQWKRHNRVFLITRKYEDMTNEWNGHAICLMLALRECGADIKTKYIHILYITWLNLFICLLWSIKWYDIQIFPYFLCSVSAYFSFIP